MSRFTRSELLLGEAAMARLAAAHVMVIGLGAVGSYTVEGLTRGGVGRLTLVDFDTVHPSNINRQLYALESTVGRRKVDLARARVLDINPAVDVHTEAAWVESDVAERLLADPPDALVDAIDSLGPKVWLLKTAVDRGVPRIFSSMGAALRLDPDAIRVGDLAETHGCPLARYVRKRLRRLGVSGGITCVYSTEPLPPDWRATRDAVAEQTERQPHGHERPPLGSLPTITGIFGLRLAHAVLRALADHGQTNCTLGK